MPGEEITQQGVTVLSPDGLGMTLHSLDRQRLMPHPHDFINLTIRGLSPRGDP